MSKAVVTCCLLAAFTVALVAGQIKTPGLYAQGGNPDARLKAVLSRPSGVRLQPTVMGNRFVGQIMAGSQQNNTYAAGQEVRAMIATAYLANITAKAQRVANIKLPSGTITSLLSLGNYSYMPAFNASGPSPVRVRVISAYATRTATVAAQPWVRCSAGSAHDVWAEFWGMAPRNLAFGGQMIFSGFVTFTAPPFNFRLCVKDVTLRNKTRSGIVTDSSRNANWMELENYKQGQIERFREPLFLWRAPPKATTHYAGDYAAFEILANNPPRGLLNGKPVNVSAFSLSDSIKLVPWGYPCTYEKRTERLDKTASTANDIKQYCGSNAVASNGEWIDTSCPLEGAVAGGVARAGSRDMNPFAATTGYPTAETTTWTSTATTRTNLIAYLQLPAAGSYDVCVSTKAYRRLRYATGLTRVGGGYNGFASQAQPVWFKAYDASSSTPCSQVTTYKSTGWVAGCQPRSTVLTVTAAATTVSWTTVDDTPGSWGEILFTAATGTTLSYTAATQWEYGTTRDYFNLTGGDMFRLVSESHFAAPSAATTGELTSNTVINTAASRFGITTSSVTRQSVGSSAGTLSTVGTGAYYQYYFGQPNIGTQNAQNTGSGCFWAQEDNFGAGSLNGNPGSQCCASATCTNWCSKNDDETAGVAGVRTSGDLGGNPRVGYSPWLADGTGSTAYAYIRVPTAGRYRVCYRTAQGHWRVLPGVSTVHPTSNTSFIPRALSKGYTYHFNDTRAGTWGPVAIRSLSGARIDKLAWTYYTTSTTAVGSALKIVTTSDSCYTTAAQSKTYNINPGSLEDGVGLGSADDSATLAQTVYFYVKVPAQDTTTLYRICFRRAWENWQALSDPNFVAHLYMTTSNRFGPRLAPGLSYTLTDTSAGSWGRFVFNRSTTATQSFNVDFRSGDMVRLVPNRTSTGLEVFCDIVVGTTTDAVKLQQVYSATMATSNLGQACAVTSSVTTDYCYSNTLTPTDNSISAMNPYTNLNVGSDNPRVGLLDGSVAFITVPPPLVSSKPYGYKVCYKQARFANWIEASGANWGTILNVKTGRTVTASPSSNNMVAGTYTYIGLTAAAAFAVTPQFDLVKLVPSTSTCEAPVVTNGGYDKYSAMSGVSAANCIVDAANSSIIANGYNAWGKATSARAYMVLPTPAAGVNPGNYHQTSYRVCYMTRTTSTTDAFNWWDLGLITVNHVAVVYTVTNKPMVNGALGIRFFSGYAYLDTRPSQDMAKVIPYYKPCVDTTGATVQPSGAATGATHAGIEADAATAGVSDVGPTDLYPAREARINVVLPSTSVGFKVCYKTATGLWMEIREAFGSQRIYLQSTTDSTIRPATSEVSKYTLATALTGQSSYLGTYSGTSWGTVAMGGAATYDGTTYYFSVTYASAVTANNAFALKLVQTYTEPSTGSYVATGNMDCFASGQQWSYSTTAGTSDGLAFNLPTISGKYLVCLWSSLTSTWYQVPADTTTATTGVPMTVVPNKMVFVPTATGLQINDYAASGTVSMAGLAALDYVYIINASSTVAACGAGADWRGVAVATAKVNLTATTYGSDSTNYLATRLATITLPATPARSGAFAVCVYRSQASASNVSGYAPFVKAGWYQVRNDGPTSTGGLSDVYVVSGATKLNVTACPTNSSTKVRAGTTFDVEVVAQDASSTLVTYPSGVSRFGVTATSVTGFTLQGANGECTPTNAPTYGYTSGALTQFMTNGKVKFSLTSLSACPNGVCTYNFVSSNGLTASPSCSFTVPPTTVADVQFAVQATSCSVWSTSGCVFRVVALHSDGGIASTINSGLTVTVRGSTGLNVNMQTLTGSSIGSPSFTNGVLDFQLLFSPSQYVAATASQTVTLTPSANGKTGLPITVTVYRPVVTAVHVVDIYPVAVTGTPILPLVPFWEPAQTGQPASFRYDDVTRNTGGPIISAAAGYHLVAGQFYNIVLKTLVTVNGVSMYAKDGNAVPSPFTVTIDPTFLTALGTAGNAIHDGRLCSTESCTSAFTGYSMGGATSGTLTLRFQNAVSCDQSCTVPLKFNGADIVTGVVNSITTPVRSVATTLRVRCATSLAGLATASLGGCGGVTSTVNRGWYLNVSAVDATGTVDRFWTGDVIAVLNNAQPAAQLTTVAALQATQAAAGLVKATAVNGFALLALTVSKPCAAGGCTLELLSTWGTNVVAAGDLVATPNTVRLTATLNKVLAYCDATSTGSTCNSVAGVSLFNTTHPRSLIYKDTQVCATVAAVDSTGLPTLYETNWVMYYARDVTGDGSTQALTLTDDKSNTGFTQRYRAMVNSQVNFCFTISGYSGARTVTINFGAQRFGGSTYWAFGSTGTAALGPMKVWSQKVIARVLLNGAVNGDVVVGGTTGVVSTAKSSASNLALGLSFVLKDHYNVTLSSGDLQSTETTKYLWPRMNADGATVTVTAIGSQQVRGFTNATLVPLSSALNTTAATLLATLSLDGACLGCTVMFDLLTPGQVVAGVVTLTNGGNTEWLGSNVTIFTVNTATTTSRVLAFWPSTSPLTSYWINGSTTTNLALSSHTAPVMHVSSCIATTCVPFPAMFNFGRCENAGPTYFGASSSTGLSMRVYTVGASSAASSVFEPATDNQWQVDILNTYTVTIGFGNQLLSCVNSATSVGAACQNDNTAAVSQTVAAFGTSVRDAIGKFYVVADSGISSTSTNFFVTGITTSTFLAINTTTNKYMAAPSAFGSFAASAASSTYTGVVSGITSPAGHAFYWKPQAEPRQLAILGTALGDPCNDTAVYSCSGGTGCNTAGLAQSGLLGTGVSFAYTTSAIPVGVAFPITMDVRDVSGVRVVGASGTVAVTTDSWTGCNNGGAPTFTGVVSNGRATVWLTFASACQACVLRFTFTPSGSQSALYNTMNANPASLIAYSSAINVVSTTQWAREIVISSALPAGVTTTGASVALTVASVVTLNLLPRGKIGNIPFAAPAPADTTFNLYPSATITSGNVWTIGNGGVLRSAAGTNQMSHGALQFTNVGSAFTATVLFSRTCVSCRIRAAYLLGGVFGGASAVTFDVPATFVVTTAATQQTLVGYIPRKVRVNAPIAVSLWATGSEDSAIAVAGVAPDTTMSTAGTPSFAVTTSTNGNGGTLNSKSWVFNVSQIQRMWFTAPCSVCTVSVSSNNFAVRVATTATALLPTVSLTAAQAAQGISRPATLVALNTWLVTPVSAVDDNGFLDEFYGTVGCQWPEDRFQCNWNTAYIGIDLSTDGTSAYNFPVYQSNFQMADSAGISQSSGYVSQGAGLVNFSFTTPQRQVVPIYTAYLNGGVTISSRLTGSGALFPAAKYSVAVGLSSLTLTVLYTQSVALMTAGVANTFYVALTGVTTAAQSNSYVAVGADNKIAVTFSAACPTANVTTTNSSLVDGYAVFNVAFLGSDNSGNCAITFSAGTGAGKCATAAACSVQVSSVLIAALTPTRFNVLRPTVWDNGVGSSAIPMYAHAGRAMRLRTQILGLGADGRSEVAVTNCPTCAMTVSSTDCNFASSPISSTFTNDQAEVSLTFPDTGANTYTCSITLRVLNANSVAIIGPDRASTSFTYLISVCKSASVKLLTNTSSTYRGQLLKTGVAYEFYAVMLTAAGAQCWGDSQDAATVLSIKAVDGLTGKTIPTLNAVNVNSTATTTDAVVNGMTVAAGTSAQVVGGAFRFQVVFTNSSVRLGLAGGIRLQVSSATLGSTVTSGRIDTVVAASRLTFDGMTQLPPFAVKSRAVYTGPNWQTSVVVRAIDPLPAAWQASGLMSGLPNIASSASEFGSTASVFWRVAPSVPGVQLPLTVGGGSSATMSAGTASFSSVTWTGPDGLYAWTVQSSTSGIAATAAVNVFAQAAVAIRLNITGFNTRANGLCTTGCTLPNATFATKTNATINNGVAFLSAQALSAFNLSVLVADASENPVWGDSESILALSLNSNSGSSVVLAAAPAFTTFGTLYARVVNGTARFSAGFIGSTVLTTGVEALASLSISCPATKPSSMVAPGESTVNPCSALTASTTATFQVVDPRLSAASVRSSALVRAAQQVLKVSQALTRFAQFNISVFKRAFLPALVAGGVNYVDQTNVDKIFSLTTCLVNSQFKSGDLGSTVCSGTPQSCSITAGLLNCPLNVIACTCQATATTSSSLLRRFLLQNSSAVNGSATSTEFYLDLAAASGFPAFTEAGAAAEYVKAQNIVLGVLQSSSFQAQYGITGVGTRSSSVLVTPVPNTAAPTSAPVVVPPSPPVTTATPDVGAASPLAMAVSLLLALILSIFA